jgi:hypothetical protein
MSRAVDDPAVAGGLNACLAAGLAAAAEEERAGYGELAGRQAAGSDGCALERGSEDLVVLVSSCNGWLQALRRTRAPVGELESRKESMQSPYNTGSSIVKRGNVGRGSGHIDEDVGLSSWCGTYEAAAAAASGGGGDGGDGGAAAAVTAANILRQAAAAVLPGEIFSSPVAAGGYVVLGCRDDHLYCLQLDPHRWDCD